MLTTRFHLRSLMILVALAAVGSWIATTIWRMWSAVSMLQRESAAALLSPAYAILALGVITSLSLIIFGVVVLALRLRGVLRAISSGSGRTRPDRWGIPKPTPFGTSLADRSEDREEGEKPSLYPSRNQSPVTPPEG